MSHALGGVHRRVEDVALLATGASHENRVHSGGVVLRDGPAPLEASSSGCACTVRMQSWSSMAGNASGAVSWTLSSAYAWVETVKGVQMGVMKRLTGIVQAKANKVLDKAEDPRETLDLSYEKQIEQLQQVKRGLADVATAKKRIELQAQQLQQAAAKLQNQARQALRAEP